jgi:predicted alpha/beta-fold hydrolase
MEQALEYNRKLDIAVSWLLVAVLVAFIAYYIFYYFTYAISTPKLYFNKNKTNEDLLSRCSLMFQQYIPSFLLWTRHISTIFGISRLFPSQLKYQREIFLFEDGADLALDWTISDKYTDDTPTLIVVPGLNGGSRAIYVAYPILLAWQSGWRCVVMNFRGTNGCEFKTARPYSAEHTDDLAAVVDYVHKKFPRAPLFCIGYSLGSNLVVKHLGEVGENTPLSGAISVSNVFDFVKSKESLQLFYNTVFTYETLRTFRKQRKVFETVDGLDWTLVEKSWKLEAFDESFTKVIFGYESAMHYYQRASCVHYLPNVKIPLLLINALDDPTVNESALPYNQCQANPHTILIVTNCGGHVSFPEGILPLLSPNWSDRVAVEYLNAFVAMKKEREQNSRMSETATFNGVDVANVHNEKKEKRKNKTSNSEVKHRR